MTLARSVADVLSDHVTLEIESIDSGRVAKRLAQAMDRERRAA